LHVSCFVEETESNSGEEGSGEGVWSGSTLHGGLADDGKRCVQPLNVAGISLVGRDGVDTWGRWFGGRGLVGTDAPRWGGGFVPRPVFAAIYSTFEGSVEN